MKTITTYIKESLELKLSEDGTANKIINALLQYKIVWKVKSVDEAITNVTDKSYWHKYFDEKLYTNADAVYKMSCLNDGNSLDKNSKYNQAEICFHKNNTDTAWFIFVTKYKCELWSRERPPFGGDIKVHKLIKFAI